MEKIEQQNNFSTKENQKKLIRQAIEDNDVEEALNQLYTLEEYRYNTNEGNLELEFYTEIFKKNINNLPKAIKIIEVVKQSIDSSRENEIEIYKKEDGDNFLKLLYSWDKLTNNYFLKKVIEDAILPPLSELTTEDKRKCLGDHQIGDFLIDISFDNEKKFEKKLKNRLNENGQPNGFIWNVRTTELTDDEIIELFQYTIEANQTSYRRNKLKETLAEYHTLPQIKTQRDTEDYIKLWHGYLNKEEENYNEERRGYYLSQISSERYGVKYNEEGEIKFFFQIQNNETKPEELKNILQKEGLISKKDVVSDLPDLITIYKKLLEPNFRKIIETDLGVSLAELSIRSQIQLINFLAGRSIENMGQVQKFCQDFGRSGLQTFLACEYDLNLGDKILEMAEQNEQGEVKKLFVAYSKLTNQSKNYGKIFQNEKVATETDEAIMRRAKDLLFVLLKTENKEENKVKKIDDIINSFEALSLLGQILEKLIKKTGENIEINPNTEQTGTPGNYFFKIHNQDNDIIYNLKIFVRPKENDDGQARINFELNFDTDKPNKKLKEAFVQEITYWPDDPKKKQVRRNSLLRIGLDLETRGLKPQVSLDLGRAERQSHDLIRTGDTLGNLLAKYEEDGGHHNTASFSPEIAEPEFFAELAQQFISHLDSLYETAMKKPQAKTA